MHTPRARPKKTGTRVQSLIAAVMEGTQEFGMTLVGDDTLVVELQRRLRLPRSTVPKAELVTIALRLVREPDLDPSVGTFWKDAGLTSSDSRNRVKQYAKRMVSEGHLAEAQQALTQPAAERSWEVLFGLSDRLLLEQRWIDEHVPNIVLTAVEPFVRSTCGAFAERIICAQNAVSSEEVRTKVKYDLPPVEGESDKDDQRRRRKMHRGREEMALRALDDDAVAAFRAKRAFQRQDLRARDAEIVDVLDKLIGAVERNIEREANAWRCPDGCAPGSTDCARVAWRERCVPTQRVNTTWAKEHTYAGLSGHEFRWEKQREMMALEPDYHEAFAVTEEMREDFLAMWDGIVEPQCFWEPWHSKRTGEWCGVTESYRHPAADQYGWDFRPVGQTACARSYCDGCCFCRGKPPLPVRLLITDQHANGDQHSAKQYLTIEELRKHIERLAKPSSRPPLEPLPVYLLARMADDEVDNIEHDGRVIRVPSDVRDYVSADELSAWAEALAPKSIMLQVLRGMVPSVADNASCREHLVAQEARRAERTARWKERAAWTGQAIFEAKFGCGLRLAKFADWPEEWRHHMKPSLQIGNIVYAPPPVKGGRHIVAVVSRIDRIEKCRTGGVDLVWWDTDKGILAPCVNHDVFETRVNLFPQCCGEGASCPHLQETMEWPNGDPMSSDDLEKLARIPFQFSDRFSCAAPSRKRAISEDDRAAMKRMRATYVPAFFKHETRRSMIKRHGAVSMEKVYACCHAGLADMLRPTGGGACDDCESDSEVSICDDGSD